MITRAVPEEGLILHGSLTGSSGADRMAAVLPAYSLMGWAIEAAPARLPAGKGQRMVKKQAAGGKTPPAPAGAAKEDPNRVEFTYRYERHPAKKGCPPPTGTRVPAADAEAAAIRLWNSNGQFAKFIKECAKPYLPPDASDNHNDVVVRLVDREVGLVKKSSGFPNQEPFAAIVGCVDARAPIELLFAQGFDDLYIARIAGNTLGPDVAGSLHYALRSFAGLRGSDPAELPSKTLRLIVALGHSDCGAVTAAVKAFLGQESLPELEGKYLPDGSVTGLLTRIQYPAVAVALEALPLGSLGTYPSAVCLHLAALIDLSVHLNAAWSAHQMLLLVQQYDWEESKYEVQVKYGVFDPRDCYVRAGAGKYPYYDPKDPDPDADTVSECLQPPPIDLAGLRSLAASLAGKLKAKASTKRGQMEMAKHYYLDEAGFK